MAISFLPESSSNWRFALSRASCAWARSTSASGVPRSIAPVICSIARVSGTIWRSPDSCSNESASGTPELTSRGTAASSSASSPREIRPIRRRASRMPSPADRLRVRNSRIVGSSPVIRCTRFRAARCRRWSLATNPAAAARITKATGAASGTGCRVSMANPAAIAQAEPPAAQSNCRERNSSTLMVVPACRRRTEVTSPPPMRAFVKRRTRVTTGSSIAPNTGRGSAVARSSRSRAFAETSATYGPTRAARFGRLKRGINPTRIQSPRPRMRPQSTLSGTGSVIRTTAVPLVVVQGRP